MSERASETKGESSAALRRERQVVAAFLLCAMLFLAHFVHDGWDSRIRLALAQGPSLDQTKRYAPDVYRVAMPALIHWLTPVLPGGHPTTALALVDFLFGYATLYCGYLLTVAKMNAGSRRFVMVAFYLACVQFPLAWVVPYQRPETLPTALYLVAGTLLLQGAARDRRRAWLLLPLSLVQGFVRADVACLFGLAILLLSVCGGALVSIAPRRFTTLLGLGVAMTAGAVQAYLQLVRFPHAVYPPGTAVLMAATNLKPHFLGSLGLVLLPVVLVLAAAYRCRAGLRAADWVALTAAAVYLPLWFAVGSFAEVRIFVPFLLLLCPVAARVLASVLVAEPARQALSGVPVSDPAA